MRALENAGIAIVGIRRADRHAGGARLHIVAMLAPVRRADGDAHALAKPVWRLMRAHVDHIDLEVRIQRVVVHDRERNVLAVLAGTFEAGEAHIVFHTGFARNERAELAFRRIGGEQQHLGGGLRTGADHDVALVEGKPDAHPEALVLLAVDLHVLGDRRADTVAFHRARTPCVIKQHIEHPPRVRCEAGATDAFEHVGKLLTRRQIADAEVVALVAAGVDAVQHPLAVFGDVHAADAEEVVPLRLDVRVEYDLFAVDRLVRLDDRRIPVVLASDRQTALHRVLFALLRAGEVPVVVHARRHRHVGFLHMRFEFLEQGRAQAFQRRHALFAIPVLRGHIILDFRRFLVAQPFVMVYELVSMEHTFLGYAFRRRVSITNIVLPISKIPP